MVCSVSLACFLKSAQCTIFNHEGHEGTKGRHGERPSRRSNPSVPRTAALPVKVPAVGHDDSREILRVLVAEMASQSQTHWSAMIGRQCLTIHRVGEQCLGVQ